MAVDQSVTYRDASLASAAQAFWIPISQSLLVISSKVLVSDHQNAAASVAHRTVVAIDSFILFWICLVLVEENQ